MNLTDNEMKALNAIVKSEYQDGGDPVDHAVWTSYCNPFKSRRTFSGVIASLVKKGCVRTGGSSEDANYDAGCDGTTLAITQAGYDALQAAQAPAPAGNARFLVAEFAIGEQKKQVYLLNPGDHFDRFGGSSHGLTVRKTASLIVREQSAAGTYDTEYPVNKRDVWNRIFHAAHAAGYMKKVGDAVA